MQKMAFSSARKNGFSIFVACDAPAEISFTILLYSFGGLIFMLAFTIHDTKAFMALLLKGNAFDAFQFHQGELTTFASFILEGKRNLDFYDESEREAGLSHYVYWEEMRPFVFQLIKGHKLPKQIKLVFSLAEEKLEHLPNISAAFLNIHFKNNTLLCTTAISQKNFSLDKSSEKLWEEYILKFFHKHEIAVEVQK